MRGDASKMRILKIITILFLICGVSLAARQIVLKFKLTNPEQVVLKPKIRVISAIPRDETGSYSLDYVVLLNNGESWAAGYNGKHTGTLFHSKDSGKSWETVKVSETGFNTKAVMFADAENGWAVGSNGLAVRTTNGGRSWESLNIPTKADLNAVDFFDSRIGYVGGDERYGNKFNDEVTGTVELHCTVDGGVTWRQCFKENEPSSVFQIVALSETEAFVLLDGTRMIRTDDQGRTWQSVPISAKVSALAFASDGVCWFVGTKGAFQYSADRGRTWEKASMLNQDLATRDWHSIGFNSDGVGLAVGENSALALTIDNGKTWEFLDLVKSDDLRGVRIQGVHGIILGAKNLYSLDLSEASGKSKLGS